MAIAIVLVLLVIGSLIFHFVSPWWFTPLASNWGSIDTTINITLWVTGAVFVAVSLFLAYVVFRYRHNKQRRSHYEPENSKLETILTLVTSVGVAAMLAPGLFVWGQFITVPEHATEVEVVGQQWHWSYRLPGADGKLGRTATQLINESNPFGLDLSDQHSQDDLLIHSNTLHLPINRPVKVLFRSKDVLHNFAVPQFRVKMDLVPGMVSYLWFTPTKTGRFELLCEELCGVAHYTMRGYVEVDSAEDYQQWQAAQRTYSQHLAAQQGDIDNGRRLFNSCASCHGANGEGNEQFNAPRISGLSAWYLTRQLNYYRAKVRGSTEQDLYGQQMIAMAASLVDDAAVNDVVTYINTLPIAEGTPITEKISSSGEQLFQNCAYCHGAQAQGNYAMNAPKLAGQHPWYLKRQIESYQQGIRGNHPQDLYGSQMRLMSKLLQNEQAVNEVVAYISSLDGTQKK